VVVIPIPIMIVIMVVPIAIRVPAMPVFIPPFVEFAPAIFARFMQVVARMLRLRTVPSVMLSSFVKPMVGPHKAMPARIVISHRAWSRTEQQESAQGRRGQCSFPEPLHTPRQKTLHKSIPPQSAQGQGLAERAPL
jgi:hypothetical protein